MDNPDKKRKVLFGGLAFILAVFIGYLIYGIIIIQLFNTFAELLRENSYYIYNGLGILAMLFNMQKRPAFNLLTEKITKKKNVNPVIHVYGKAIDNFTIA
jgi:hypothetical protein